jgi:hypothetical protein
MRVVPDPVPILEFRLSYRLSGSYRLLHWFADKFFHQAQNHFRRPRTSRRATGCPPKPVQNPLVSPYL